jgi:stage II sporulation protein P
MLVVGTNQGGTHHPDWQENLSLALKTHALVERAEPGLCRNIDLRTERFNQHLSPGYLLVEVGSTGNTMPEALAAGGVFAEALVTLLVSA